MDFEARNQLVEHVEIASGEGPWVGALSLDGPCEPGSILPVILSGGAGSRLWPYSTEDTPKQFLSFTGSKSLFQMTLDRVGHARQYGAPIVVASARHAELCQRELSSHAAARLILEPCARNTAPAIVMAAVAARETHGDDILLLVMPSDHIIDDLAAFHDAVAAGRSAAKAGRLVTFGVRPTDPETGFGYIHAGTEIAGAPGVHEVSRFVEKPQRDAAEQMIADGQHFWNAGIFLFRAGTFMEEVGRHAPAIALAAENAVRLGRREGNRIIADEAAFSACPGESVDYAVMEHSSRIAVVPMSPGWSDLGSWDALASLMPGEDSFGPVTALDCDDCFIRSDGLQVAALGIRDLIVVASGKRILILPRGRSQEVKKLLSAMDAIAA